MEETTEEDNKVWRIRVDLVGDGRTARLVMSLLLPVMSLPNKLNKISVHLMQE